MSSLAAPLKPSEPPTRTKAGKGRKVQILVVCVLLIATAGYFFLLKPSAAEAPPEPGEVVTLEPIQVNLAAGRYLRIGIALQLTADAEEVDGSSALDATIELFSGEDIEVLTRPETRAEMKKELQETLLERYEGDVMDVYYTDFVTQ